MLETSSAAEWLQVTGGKLIYLFTKNFAIFLTEERVDAGSALTESDCLIADDIHQLLKAWNSGIEELFDIGEKLNCMFLASGFRAGEGSRAAP